MVSTAYEHSISALRCDSHFRFFDPLRYAQNDSDGVVFSSLEVWVDSGCGVREALNLTRDGADLKLFGRQGVSFSLTIPDIF